MTQALLRARDLLFEDGPRARRAVLSIVVVGVPVLFLRVVNDPFNVPKMALLFAGTAVGALLAVAHLLQGEDRSWLRILAVPAAAIVAPLALGWAFSPYRGWSLFGFYGRFQGLLPYAFVVLMGILVAGAFRGRTRELAWCFTIAGAIVAAYGIFQIVGLDPFVWAAHEQRTQQAISTLGNSNFAGAFLALALPITLALWRSERARQATVARLLVLIGAGLIVSFSQGGWAGATAGLAVTGGSLVAGRYPRARTLGLLAAAAVALAAVGAVLVALVRPNLALVPVTIQSRADWWLAAARMASESPVVGRGPNTFAVEGVRYRTERDALLFGYGMADDPHSVPLALTVGAGVAGVVGYVLLVGWTIRRGLALDRDDLLGAGFFGATVGYFVQSLVSIDELSLRVAFWAALAGLAVSGVVMPAAARARRPKKAVRAREPLRARPALAVLGVLAVAALWWSASFVLADGRAWQGNKLFQEGKPEEASVEFQRALSFRDEENYRRRYGIALGQAAVAQGAPGAPLMERSREILSYLVRFPEVSVIANQGKIEHAWAAHDPDADRRAEELFERALVLDPLNPVIKADFAELLVAQERYDEALALLQQPTYAMTQRYPQILGLTALAKARLGDLEGAAAAAESALALDPEQHHARQAQEIIRGL